MFSICTSLIPPIVYLSCTSTSWEFSHQVILCHSMMTHIMVFSPRLSNITKIQVGILGLPNEGGLGPVSSQIIVSTTSMTTRARIFYMAQTQKPIPFVLSVWACTCTTSSHVMHPEHGMAIMWQWPRGPEVTFAYEGMILPSAWTGKELQFQAQHQTHLFGLQYCL